MYGNMVDIPTYLLMHKDLLKGGYAYYNWHYYAVWARKEYFNVLCIHLDICNLRRDVFLVDHDVVSFSVHRWRCSRTKIFWILICFSINSIRIHSFTNCLQLIKLWSWLTYIFISTVNNVKKLTILYTDINSALCLI